MKTFLSLQFFAGIFLILSLVSTAAYAQQNPRELFEQARMLDESNQNLAEAIALYGQVAALADGQRTLAAEAQLRVGLLYNRLGRTAEAQRAFAVVVDEYSDQMEVARKAQARMVAAESAGESKDDGITVRQVLSGDEADLTGSVSPDGHYLSYVNWNTGNLALHDLATGDRREITQEGDWSGCNRYAGRSVWSPDGKQIAYYWFDCDVLRPFITLRVIELDHPEPRLLYSNAEVSYVEPVAWTLDGREVVALTQRLDRTWQIALISAADGSARVLKTLDWRRPQTVSLSPDGRYLTYDFPSEEDGGQRDIFLLNMDGSRETRLIEHPGNDLHPVWTPGGEHLLFVSDRNGAPGLWMVKLAGEGLAGAPELVRADIGHSTPLGFGPEGTFYYGTSVGRDNIYTLDLDPEAVTVVGEPALAVKRFVGWNSMPGWSPDGRYLAYLSERTPEFVIVIRDVINGTERTLAPQIAFVRHRSRLRWSPDGRSLLTVGSDPKARRGLYAIDVETAAVTPVLQDGNIHWGVTEWMPDGSGVVFVRAAPDLQARIFILDLDSGQEREVARGTFASPSPDGRSLVYRNSRAKTSGGEPGQQLIWIDLAGGEPRPLTEVMPVRAGSWWNFRIYGWTPDGQYILFGVLVESDEDTKEELWRVSVRGGDAEQVAILTEWSRMSSTVASMRKVCDAQLSPDGRRLAFSQCNSPREEVWVMENFLPENDGTQ